MPKATFPDLAETLGSLLRRPYEKLQESLYERLAAGGFPEIRSAHSAVFRNLAPDGSRLTDLAAAASMTKQSMAYLVEALAGEGYVDIQPDLHDGRAKRVVLTAKGRRCIQTALNISQDLEKEAARLMSKGNMKVLRQLLKELDQTLAPPC